MSHSTTSSVSSLHEDSPLCTAATTTIEEGPRDPSQTPHDIPSNQMDSVCELLDKPNHSSEHTPKGDEGGDPQKSSGSTGGADRIIAACARRDSQEMLPEKKAKRVLIRTWETFQIRSGRPFHTVRSWWKRQSWWPWEVLCWLISLAFLGAIIAVLATFNNKEIPQWRYGITPNALISVFATINAFLLMVPVAAAMGQLKWVWFRNARPLKDFEAIDEASKGPTGSFMLLMQGRGSLLLATGASLTIAVLAVGPFIQQILAYEARHSVVGKATISIAAIFPSMSPLLNLDMKAAILSGALNAEANNATIVPDCPTGNCTWPLYQSLAVCSQCANITNILESEGSFVVGDGPSHFNSTSLVLRLPNGAMLNTSALWPTAVEEFNSAVLYGDKELGLPFATTLNITNNYPILLNNTWISLPTLAFENQGPVIIDTFAIAIDPYTYDDPWAAECILQFCIKTFNSSMVNGIFQEQEVDRVTSTGPTTTLSVSQAGHLRGFDEWQRFPGHLYDEAVFLLDEGYLSEYLGNMFLGNATVDGYGRLIWSSIITEAFDTNAAYSKSVIDDHNSGWETAWRRTPWIIFGNIARSLTVAMRNDYPLYDFSGGRDGLINGTATRYELYVDVRWPWIILPAALQVLALVFLILVILNTRHHGIEAYKDGVLATLFHGIDEDRRRLMEPLNDVDGMEEMAEEINVQLMNGATGWRLVPVDLVKNN